MNLVIHYEEIMREGVRQKAVASLDRNTWQEGDSDMFCNCLHMLINDQVFAKLCWNQAGINLLLYLILNPLLMDPAV
jgi:hypothetical protein